MHLHPLQNGGTPGVRASTARAAGRGRSSHFAAWSCRPPFRTIAVHLRRSPHDTKTHRLEVRTDETTNRLRVTATRSSLGALLSGTSRRRSWPLTRTAVERCRERWVFRRRLGDRLPWTQELCRDRWHRHRRATRRVPGARDLNIGGRSAADRLRVGLGVLPDGRLVLLA